MKRKRALTFLFCYSVIIYLEAFLKLFTHNGFDVRFIYTLLFGLPWAGMLFLFTLFTEKLWAKIAFNAAMTLLTVYFITQLVYHAVFGGFLSLSLAGMGADAITNFSSQLLTAIKQSAFGIAVILLPILISVIFTCKKLLLFKSSSLKLPLLSCAGIAAAHIICLCALMIGGTGLYTAFDVYYSPSGDINTSIKNFGALTSARLEIQNMLFGNEGADQTLSMMPKDDIQGQNVAEYNMLNIDFDALTAISPEGTEKEIAYIMQNRAATRKNEYTAAFKGKNLITICAEAFSPYVIDKELTPVLYKLSHEGFVFENFYSSYESVTTNGEYALCFGMFPDQGSWEKNSSFMHTTDNTMPYTLGNMFRNAGVKTYAYHNYMGTYYNRNETHPHMGYDVFRTPDNGLNVELSWPSSDLDMFKESVDEYVFSGEPFHTYYMTFSGHYQYNWENPMSQKHKAEVAHLDYSDTVKAYIACNLELEYGLEYLMQRLEEAGIADDTVIVLTADHYPYGLNEEEYNELAGKKIDTAFEKYHNCFICWSGDMKEPVKISKLCSTVDILPTLLNLFGFEYDSRFIIGKDILSDCEGIAILSNQSFITDKYKFNSVDNKVTMLTDETVSEEELNTMQHYIISTFGLSKCILNTDYYKYFEKCIIK